MLKRIAALALPLIAVVAWRVSARAAAPVAGPWDTGTFSILGYDPKTGELGGAAQ